MNTTNDITKTYGRMMTKVKITLLVIVVFTLLKFTSSVYLDPGDPYASFLGLGRPYWRAGLIVPALLLGLLVRFYWRCPNCGKSPGLTFFSKKNCQSCDITLR